MTSINTSVEDFDILSGNRKLAEILELIANYYTLSRDTYRAKAFTNAAQKISVHPIIILSGSQARRELTGIGESIESTIDEYIQSKELTGHGSIKRLKDLEAKFIDRQKVIDFFTSFYGIGTVTAVKLYDQGLRTLDDIWFKGNLTEAQKVGILWREHIPIRIPRDEMELINIKIGEILNKYEIKWNIAGSYRRQEPSSGDIDILVEARADFNMDGLIQLLQKYLPAKLAQGPTKYMGIFRLDDNYIGHRIDIRLIDKNSYSFALLYFTGSQRINILMRQRAIDLGLSLNEYGLYDSAGTSINADTEEDIFNIMRIKYLQPFQRVKTLDHLDYF